MEESLNIIQKLSKIRKIADIVSKDKKGYNYTYADITEILAKVKAGMEKYGVSLIPMIVPGTSTVSQNVVVNTKVDKTGRPYEQKTSEMLFDADMVFKWVNDSSPSDQLEVPWHVVGSQADPSQAFGSGLTYCTRYFLTDYFQIAQDNDVDAYRSKQKAAAAAEEKEIADGIIAQFDEIIKVFMADNPTRKDEVKKFISRFVKDANYFAIKEPVMAAKLMDDFKNKKANSKQLLAELEVLETARMQPSGKQRLSATLAQKCVCRFQKRTDRQGNTNRTSVGLSLLLVRHVPARRLN